ncbi:MAG: hypothetical protein R3313_05195, partial [Candidatus Saccharimonadales bacterium]|nr:hypothetical protein [Candidatus Saccharimonadales bacterium]
AGGGGYTFDVTDGTTTQTINNADTLTFADGTGTTVAVSATDTVTYNATLGTAIDTSEITNGTILFEDIASNSCTSGQIIEWNGSAWICGADDAGGGSYTFDITDGTTTETINNADTITYAAGAGLTIAVSAADTVTYTSTLGAAIDNTEITDATILFADLNQNGCTSGQTIEWNGSAWICGTDSDSQNLFETFTTPAGTSPVADSTTDSLTFLNGSGITITGNSTTDEITVAAVLGTSIDNTEIENGTILFADVGQNGCSTNDVMEWSGTAWECDTDNDPNVFGTIDTEFGTDPVADSPTDTLTFTGGDGVTVTGTASSDTVNVSLDLSTSSNTTTASSSSGLELTTSGLQLLGGCDDGQVLIWDDTGVDWECGDLLAAGNNAQQKAKTADETVTNSTTLQNDDHLSFPVGANETWIYFVYINPDGPANVDIKYDWSVPSGTTCESTAVSITGGGVTFGNLACATATGGMPTSNDVNTEHLIFGTINSGATSGTAQLRWAQFAARTTGTTVKSGSWLQAYRVSGADLAEIYFSEDYSIGAGEIVALTGDGPSQVERGSIVTREKAFGVVSTKPGQVIGEADGDGKPLEIALAGRVPVKVKGPIDVGEYIQVSETPGVGESAKTSGQVLGKALTPFTGEGEGTVMMLVEPGYWQAPISFDLDSIFGEPSLDMIDVDESLVDLGELGLDTVVDNRTTYSSFDQAAVDEFLRGFQLLQDQIDKLDERLATLEEPAQDTIGLSVESIVEGAEDGALVGDERFIQIVMFDNQVFFNQEVIFNSDQAGVATIDAGQLVVEVEFENELSRDPVITLTPGAFIDGAYRYYDVEKTGFTIELQQPQLEDVEFSWQATL